MLKHEETHAAMHPTVRLVRVRPSQPLNAAAEATNTRIPSPVHMRGIQRWVIKGYFCLIQKRNAHNGSKNPTDIQVCGGAMVVLEAVGPQVFPLPESVRAQCNP